MNDIILGIAEEYQAEAGKFCCYVEFLNDGDCRNYSAIAEFLSRIYTASLKLPDVEPEAEGASESTTSKVDNLFGDNDYYWENHNPFECDEFVGCSLSEDLMSIYDDLRKGLDLYTNGNICEALWYWRFSFRSHWSFHAVDALRALNHLAMD